MILSEKKNNFSMFIHSLFSLSNGMKLISNGPIIMVWFCIEISFRCMRMFVTILEKLKNNLDTLKYTT